MFLAAGSRCLISSILRALFSLPSVIHLFPQLSVFIQGVMTHMAAACAHMSERSYVVICSIAIINDTGRRQEGQTTVVCQSYTLYFWLLWLSHSGRATAMTVWIKMN